jgi:plasmid maintenance system antidote protein VapI
LRVFGNSPDFWLNVQRRSDLSRAMNAPESASGSNERSRCALPRDFANRFTGVDGRPEDPEPRCF